MANMAEPSDLQDSLTLKLWEGDESAKGELLVAWGTRVEQAIRNAFPTLSFEDCEDVVAEAIRRFWMWREKYDPRRAAISTMLYKFAAQVAVELRTGRLKWQQSQIREKGVDADFFERIEAPVVPTVPADDHGPRASPVQKALATCFAALPALQKDILLRYGEAGGFEIDAATVGRELGEKYKSGVPIPGGTVRTYRSRAWDSLDICMKKKSFDLKALGYLDE